MSFPHTPNPPRGPEPGYITVRFFFSGLFVFRCDNSSGNPVCEIGVHNRPRRPHAFSLEFFQDGIVPPPAPNSALFRVPGPIAGPLSVEVTGPAKGVSAFQAGASANENISNALDLKTLHPDLMVIDPGLHPNIRIDSGTLYSAKLSQTMYLIQNGQQVGPGRPITETLGLVVKLEPNTGRISFKLNGVEIYSLPRPQTEVPGGTDYAVYVDNMDKAITPGAVCGDFREYYEVINKGTGGPFPDPERYDVCSSPHTLLLGTTDVPCMPVLNGG